MFLIHVWLLPRPQRLLKENITTKSPNAKTSFFSYQRISPFPPQKKRIVADYSAKITPTISCLTYHILLRYYFPIIFKNFVLIYLNWYRSSNIHDQYAWPKNSSMEAPFGYNFKLFPSFPNTNSDIIGIFLVSSP